MGTEQIFQIIRFKILGIKVAINLDTVIYTFLILGILFFLGLIYRKNVKLLPTRFQIIFEDITNYFRSILYESLEEKGLKFVPFVTALFLFVLFSNWLNLIPGLKSPTRDLNTTLGLALLVLLLAHYNALRTKGIRGYIKGYFSPYWFMFPSNIFSEFGKTLSHAFRLYGNIFAGGIIIGVIPHILVKFLKFLGIPVGVVIMIGADLFFGVFVGAIQAFVFAMLAVAYITILAG